MQIIVEQDIDKADDGHPEDRTQKISVEPQVF